MKEKAMTVPERKWFRIALAMLLVLHGAIHVLAPLAVWGLVDFENIDGEPTIALSTTVENALGAVWLAVLAMFVVAGVAALNGRGLWIPLSLAAVAVSQVLIVVWWEGAWRGTIANALILLVVWVALHESRATKQRA